MEETEHNGKILIDIYLQRTCTSTSSTSGNSKAQ